MNAAFAQTATRPAVAFLPTNGYAAGCGLPPDKRRQHATSKATAAAEKNYRFSPPTSIAFRRRRRKKTGLSLPSNGDETRHTRQRKNARDDADDAFFVRLTSLAAATRRPRTGRAASRNSAHKSNVCRIR